MQKLAHSIRGVHLHGGFGLVLLVLCISVPLANGQNFSSWSAAVNVGSPINMSSGDGCPFIAKNNVDLYFRSNRPGGYGGFDIYVSHRNSVDDPWETPINLGPEVNTSAGELCSFVTNDGHWLYFVSNRTDLPGCGGQDLWVSRRKDKRDDHGWATPKNLGCFVNSAGDETGPSLFEDEATGQSVLYFNSPRSGGQDIWASKMAGDDKDTFLPPSPVVELNTTFIEVQPFVRRKDGLEILFVSNRTGGSGFDLWASTRHDTFAPWSPPVNLGPLVNSASGEYRPSISWDGTTLYFWSDRPGGQGSMDVYMATRTKLPD